jgi:predicted metalloprotease with PDZ domain
MVADSAGALEMPAESVTHYKQLVSEAMALFGARHYRNYHFLLTLSDAVLSNGLEHHESSDNRVPERTLIDEVSRGRRVTLLPHEYTHSWNGKYRRPAGLATPDYQQPMQGELLWVYEGMTQYIGNLLLTSRSGLRTPEQTRDYLAYVAANLDNNRPGRNWRPLADTATAAQFLYNAPTEGQAARRGVDFYDEGLLVWLEADTIIRRQSGGRRSLDDFCRSFHGGQSGAPAVRPYTFDDVVAAFNEVVPYDWRGFFTARVFNINARPPLGGVEASGWKLVYTDTPNWYSRAGEQVSNITDASFSIGLLLESDGAVRDIIPGLAAAEEGIRPGMKIVAVNGRKLSTQALHNAIKSTKGSPATAPLELLVERAGTYTTYQLKYHEGERYPHLVRDETRADLLGQIIKPLR